MKPLVSVIIPTYNHAHLILDALISLQNQSIADWEAIVVNNFSEDDTESVISTLNDSRVKVFNFRNNGVIAASRNYGAKQANSELLAFLDSDDVWYPRKLELSLKKIKEGCDLVCHGEDWVSIDGDRRPILYGPSKNTSYENLLFKGNCLSSSAVTIRLELFKSVHGFSENPLFNTVEDYDLWLSCAYAGANFGFVDEILGEYRLHGGNQCVNAERNYKAQILVLNKHFSRFNRTGFFNRLRERRRYALAAYTSGRFLQDSNLFSDANIWLKKAAFEWPFALKSWVALGLNLLRIKP